MSQVALPAMLCDLLSLLWRNAGDRRVPKQVLAWDGVPLATLLGGGHHTWCRTQDLCSC